MVARSVPGVRVSNDELAAVARHDPKRLIGIASVDPIELGRDGRCGGSAPRRDRTRLQGHQPRCGLLRGPDEGRRRAPDAALRAVPGLGVPAFVMSGPTTPDLRLNDPFAVDRVAKTFPKLPIVCCHGFYPHVDDMVTVAFRNENVFVSPDMYTFAPGGRLYVEAANGFMKDQFLFGSSFPFRPMRQGVEDFRALGLSDEALAHAFWRNADRLLGLGLSASHSG